MILALSGKNKICFVIETIKKPTEGNLLSSWEYNNDIITSWIINSISKEITASLVYNGNVKEICDELKERYPQSNGPHIYQLWKDLVTTQRNLSVEVYYAKVTTIWQKLVEYWPIDECTRERSKKMIKFLNVGCIDIPHGLNESFSQIRA